HERERRDHRRGRGAGDAELARENRDRRSEYPEADRDPERAGPEHEALPGEAARRVPKHVRPWWHPRAPVVGPGSGSGAVGMRQDDGMTRIGAGLAAGVDLVRDAVEATEQALGPLDGAAPDLVCV